MDEKTFRRFTAKVRMPEAPDGCMEWTAYKDKAGYGHFSIGRKMGAAHRAAYEHFVGSISDGLDVLHSCDNPGCVRPDHLSVGTHQDNMRDMARKERSRATKLTGEKVLEIRNRYASGETQQALADAFGLKRTGIAPIIRGETWAHLHTPAACAAVSKAGGHNVKLSEYEVREIRERYAAGGTTQRDIALEYGISQTNVSVIISGKSRQSVTPA